MREHFSVSTGLLLSGTLVAVNPPYSHGFGDPIPALSTIGDEVRKMLRDREGSQ